MAKKKICKVCKYMVEEDTEACPNCDSKGQWNQNFQGRAYIFDANSSYIGKRLGAKVKGEFAIKSRS